MEKSFSFKYIKLGVSLVFLLVSTIVPALGQYIFLVLGGIFLMIAFASFGNYDYRGVQSKLPYRIGRYVLAALLLITGGIQIDYAINFPDFVHYSVYATVIDCSLIAYLLFYKPSNTSLGKKIWKGIGYALVLIGVNALQNTKEFVMHLTYSSEEVNWGMFGLICGTLIAGTVCIRIGSKTTERDTTDDICIDESTTQSYTSSKGLMKNKTENMVNVSDSKHKKYRSKQIILNIILSMALIIYMCSSLSFMDEGDGLTACGVIFYIPCCFIITTYYLWLIWSKGKATGAKMLLLPLLQRVNLFRTYHDDLKGKIELAKTVLPFLLSVFICPMLTSILYYNVCYNKHSQQEWLMVILLLPPVILVISLAKSWVQSWVSQNDHSEVEE